MPTPAPTPQGANALVTSNIYTNGIGAITAVTLAAVLTYTISLFGNYTTTVNNNTALSAIASTTYTQITRLGFAAAGDSPPVLYISSNSACSLNSGSGDGGSQVPSSDGKCWIGSFKGGVPLLDFGAACNGTTNDFTAWSNAYAAAAAESSNRLVLPAGNCFLGSNTAVVTASGINIGGAGIGATKISGSASTVLQIGTPSVEAYDVVLHDLGVFGSVNDPSTSTICIDWNNFNYGFENNTDAENCGILRRATDSASSGSQVSIGLILNSPLASNATSTMLDLADVAGVHVIKPQFGKNGGDSYASPCMITLSLLANGNEIDGGDIIPQGPSANSVTSDICYDDATTTNDALWLNNINTEDYLNVVSSDGNTPQINSLQVTGGRFGGGPTKNFFALNAATALRAFNMTGADESSVMTIPQSAGVSLSSMSGVNMGGALSVTGGCAPGGGTLTLQSGFYNCVGGTATASDFSVTGGVMTGALTFAGTFENLQTQIITQFTYADTSTCDYNHYCKDMLVRGTFTPTLVVAGSACTQPVLSSPSGDFSIDHDAWTVNVSIPIGTAGSCSGATTIGALPFTNKNGFGGGYLTSYSGLSGISYPVLFAPVPAASSVAVLFAEAAAAVAIPGTDFATSGTFSARATGTIQ